MNKVLLMGRLTRDLEPVIQQPTTRLFVTSRPLSTGVSSGRARRSRQISYLWCMGKTGAVL